MTSAAQPVLRVQDLVFAHPGRAPLFSHWSADVGPGLTLLRGGESRGKTSLLQLAAGALQPQAGVLALSQDDALPTSAQRFWIAPRTQAHDQTVARDVLQAIASAYPHFDHAGLPALLDGLGLTQHIHKPVYMLSTGSRRKLWLAGALSAHATLTLVDEPFAALDRTAIAFIVRRLLGMADELRERRHAWMLADYEAYPDLHFDGVVDLGD